MPLLFQQQTRLLHICRTLPEQHVHVRKLVKDRQAVAAHPLYITSKSSRDKCASRLSKTPIRAFRARRRGSG